MVMMLMVTERKNDDMPQQPFLKLEIPTSLFTATIIIGGVQEDERNILRM